MAWQNKPQSNRTFGIVLAIAIQALFVAALMIGLRVVNTGEGPIIDIQFQKADNTPQPPEPNPPKPDDPRQHNPDPDSHPIPLPPVPECDDCGPTRGPVTNAVYPTPGFGACRPDYPAPDKRLGHEGTVTVNVCVDDSGNATSANLKKSSGYPLMDRSAVEWAGRIKWRPGRVNGHVAAMCFDQGYRFRLDD